MTTVLLNEGGLRMKISSSFHHVLWVLLAALSIFSIGCGTTYYYPYQITSEPDGAHVTDLENGRSIGETPTEVFCPALWVSDSESPVCINKRFLIEKRAHEQERRSLKVCWQSDLQRAMSNPAHMHVVLDPLASAMQQQQQTVLLPGGQQEKGTVTVVSTPEGCELYIDGVFTGNTPATLKLKEGIHIIQVKQPGFNPQEKQLRIYADSDLNLSFELLPQGSSSDVQEDTAL